VFELKRRSLKHQTHGKAQEKENNRAYVQILHGYF